MRTWLSSPRIQIAIGAALPAAVVALVIASRIPDALPPVPDPRSAPVRPTLTPALVAALPQRAVLPAATVKVYVSGAVRAPGVYTLMPNDRVEDALNAAGGPDDDADLTRLNLAQRVRDEQQIHVPTRPNPATATGPTGGVATSPESEGLIDLNTATLQQLDTLPGIGPVTARRILDYRAQHGPFARVDDLRALKLVTPSTYEKIKDRLIVR